MLFRSPAYFGIAPNNYNTLSDTYGKMTDHWNGMDFTVNARLAAVTVQGGYSFGRESINACDVTAKVPELLNNSAGASPAPLAGPGFTGAGFNLANVWLSPANCNNKEAWQHQLKLVGIYTVPKIDVMVSGTYQDTPGRSEEHTSELQSH